MPIDFQTQRVDFPPSKGNDQGTLATLTFEFPTEVLRASATISGFDFEFVSTEHAFHQARIDTTVREPHGNLGQFIYVDPTSDVVVVRMGDEYGLPVEDWPAVLRAVANDLDG